MLMKHLPKLSSVEKEFGLVGGIMAVAGSAYGIILPLVIRSISQSDQTVGYYYTALAVIGFLVAIFSTYLFSNFNKIKVFRVNVFVSLTVLFSMTFLQDHVSFYIIDLVRALCLSISGMSITLMIKEMVQKRDIKTSITKYLQFTGLGSMFGAFAGGYTAKYFGNSSIFIIAGILVAIAFFLFMRIPILKDLAKVEEDSVKKIRKKKESPLSIFKYFKEYFTDSNKRNFYSISALHGVWSSVFSVYFPIIIIRLQYNQDVIGNVKVGMALLGLLFTSRILKLSDKYKFKYLFFAGWVAISLFSFSFSIFSNFETAFLLFGIFVFTRIPGILTGELRPIYFFAITTPEESDKYYGIYKTGYQFGSIMGPLIASLMLSISLFIFDDNTLNLMWIGMAIIAGWTSLIALKIKNPS